MRPPGYEPGELPTAPLRDISFKRVQRYTLLNNLPNKIAIILVIQHFFRYLAKNKRETDKKTWRNKK